MSRYKISPARAAHLERIERDLGRRTAMAMLQFQIVVAERLGLSLTDLFCGELLSRTGPLTAGELADLAGLTTGAITGVIDRLEKLGLVRRENDPHDRRRVIVRALPEEWEKVGKPLYNGLNAELDAAHARYSDQELATIADYLRVLGDAYAAQAAALRGAGIEFRFTHPGEHVNVDARARMRVHPPLPTHRDERVREFSAPLRKIQEGHLEWQSGASELRLDALTSSTELYHARFEKEIPTVRVQDGSIAVQYRQRTLFGRGGGKAAVELNAAIPWEVALDSGPSDLRVDLALPLRGFTLRSKGSKLRLNLGVPKGTVNLRLECTASDLVIHRPVGVPARLEAEGGWSNLLFDKRRLREQQLPIDSPGYREAADRYHIAIVGSANKVRIDTV